MAFCLAELHCWSSRSVLQVTDTDIGTYQYYEKGEAGKYRHCLLDPSTEHHQHHHYYKEKRVFSESRGYSWTPRNRRPEKLRDSLKELEDLLQTNSVVHSRWKTKHCCQLALSSGVLVTLTLNGSQLDRVCVDRTLVGRLPADTVSSAVLSDRMLLLSFVERNQVCIVYLNRKNQSSSPDASRPPDKLSPSEIKVLSVEVCAGPGRRLGRRVGLNLLLDVAVCWWPLASPDQWPWTPNTHTDNLTLLSCSSTEGLKVLSSMRTGGDPLDVRFSLLQPYHLLSVELPEGPQVNPRGPHADGPGASWADACVYECARGRLQRLSVTRIPLSSRPISCSRHPSESALLLGLGDSSLVLYDERRGVTLLAPCPVPPSLVAWHPAGGLAVVGGGQGEVMGLDVGLGPLGLTLVGEDPAPAAPTLRLAQHLRCPGGLEGLQWAGGSGPGGGTEGVDTLMLTFHRGPLVAMALRLGALSGGQLGPEVLLQQRLRCCQVDQALGILGAMDWSTMGSECYRALISITDHLLRLDLNQTREVQLEAALGVFYAPTRPLSDTVVLEYREPISKYARRFFHHLLRHQRFEKAFLLAVDIGARDLFMDLHYVASDKGEVVLAEVAQRKANEIDADEANTTTPGNRVLGEPPSTPRGRPGPCGATLGDGRTERPSPTTGGRVDAAPAGPGSQESISSRQAVRTSRSWPVEESYAGNLSPDVAMLWRQTDIRMIDRDDKVSAVHLYSSQNHDFTGFGSIAGLGLHNINCKKKHKFLCIPGRF
ncbi:WD repeat-containing and planar cell polarity effector protein fritz homolog isoform X2 [Esox lucius]|uniref:WD repeat-containing and planar cell polarity effector protein fritz homolog isoform X2 n=1 Tax=Esox lucius TaxID=8010 RepID=UPI0014777F11|nr:WD repeat-containing and planar cell polarity effector protein fritz homolog isoform X2 [Esox lucius]